MRVYCDLAGCEASCVPLETDGEPHELLHPDGWITVMTDGDMVDGCCVEHAILILQNMVTV